MRRNDFEVDILILLAQLKYTSVTPFMNAFPAKYLFD